METNKQKYHTQLSLLAQCVFEMVLGPPFIWINPWPQIVTNLQEVFCYYLWCLDSCSLLFSAKYPDPSGSPSILLAFLPVISCILVILPPLSTASSSLRKSTFLHMWETWLPACYEKSNITFLSDHQYTMILHHICRKTLSNNFAYSCLADT